MNVDMILRTIELKGIQLWVSDNHLEIETESANLTDELLEGIQRHKADLIRQLQKGELPILGSRLVNPTDHSERTPNDVLPGKDLKRNERVARKSPVYDKPYVEVLADELRLLGVPEADIHEMQTAFEKYAPKGLQMFASLKQAHEAEILQNRERHQ